MQPEQTPWESGAEAEKPLSEQPAAIIKLVDRAEIVVEPDEFSFLTALQAREDEEKNAVGSWTDALVQAAGSMLAQGLPYQHPNTSLHIFVLVNGWTTTVVRP